MALTTETCENFLPNDKAVMSQVWCRKDAGRLYQEQQGYTDPRMQGVRAYARCKRWVTANRKRSLEIKNKWRRENPELVRQIHRQDYERHKPRWTARKSANRERINARYREQYAQNPEQWKQRQSKYECSHPERVRALAKAAQAKRRRQIMASDTHYTAADVLRLYDQQRGRCAEPSCPALLNPMYHVDHIMPLVLGGSNGPENIQLLCPKCNLKKNRKHPLEWARMNGRLF